MKNLKWILIRFTELCAKKIWKMLFFPKNELIGTKYVPKIALITLQRKLPTFFSPELALMSTRSMIRESRFSSKKSLDVQKCCVSVAKHIVVMMNRLTNTILAAKVSKKEHWKSVAMMDQWHNMANCWKRQSTLLQLTEDFERISIVLRRMNKQRKDCFTFIKKSRRRWNTHEILTLASFHYS